MPSRPTKLILRTALLPSLCLGLSLLGCGGSDSGGAKTRDLGAFLGT